MNVRLNNLNSLERQESFGRKNKKADEKQNYTTQPQSGIGKKARNGFVGAGLALASLLGMSSCTDVNQYNEAPEIPDYSDYFEAIIDRLDQVIENQDDENSNSTLILEALQKIFKEQQSTNANMEDFKTDLISLLTDLGVQNSEFREQILAVLNDQHLSDQQKYDQIIDLMTSIGNKLDKLDSIQNSIDNLEQTVSVGNDKLANLIKEAILEFKDGNLTLQELNLQIAEWIANSNLQNQEVIEKMNQIIEKIENGQTTEESALSQIAAILQTISDDVKDIANQLKALAELVSTGDKQLSDDIKNLTNKYEQGNADLNSTLLAILDRSEQQCTNDATIIAEIQAIKDKIESGEMSSSEALNAIKDILNSINSNIEAANEKLDNVIAKLGDIDTNLGSKLDALINKYDQGAISQEELLSLILAETIQSNQISTNILTEVKNIKAQYEAGNIDLTTALDKLTQLVQDIKDISQETLDTLKQLAADFNAYRTENDTNLKNLGSQLGQVISGVGNIEQQLANLNKTADAIYGSTTKLGTTIDNIYAELGNIKNEMGSGLTKEELEEIIASKEPELFQAYQQMLDVIAQGNTKLDNIIDIMSAFSGFGDKLDGMSEKVSQLIALMQTSNQTQLDNATNIINEIKNLAQGGTANTDAINAKLDEAIGLLGDMKELLEQISNKLNTVITNQEAHQEKADSYMTQSMDVLTQILAKMVSGEDFGSLLTKFDSYVSQNQSYNQQLIQDNAEFKELLRELIAKQGGSNGMTKEEMVEAIKEGLTSLNIPNYSEVLASIDSKLDDIFKGLPGDSDITLENLEQLFQKYQSNADLSLTNELLDQILSTTGMIANNVGQGGSGVGSTATLESLVSQVIEAVKSGSTSTSEGIQALQKALLEIRAELEKINNAGQGGEVAQTRSSLSQFRKAMAGIDNYSAYANLLKAEYKANDGQVVRSASASKYEPDTFYWRA